MAEREIVARTTAGNGGPCRHCTEYIPEGEPVFKVAPECCHLHPPRVKGKNGPGSWVCRSCATWLMRGEIRDG